MSAKAQSQKNKESKSSRKIQSELTNQPDSQTIDFAQDETFHKVKIAPRALNQESVLFLQRTSGNKAVNRLLGSRTQKTDIVSDDRGGMNLQRDPNISKQDSVEVARYSDPSSAEFWEGTRRDARQTLLTVLRNNTRALEQLTRDLQSRNESASGSIAVDVVDFALDLAGASPAAKFSFKVLQRIYQQLMAVRSGSITLAAFTRNISDAHQRFQDEIPNEWSAVSRNSPDLFKRLKELKDAETDQNRTAQRTTAVSTLRSADQSIPGYRIIMRKMVQAWVAGAQDQRVREALIDLPDPSGFQTGYLRIYANIEVDTRNQYLRHSFQAISIDDVDSPEGVKQALITAWGSNYYLDELPFPGIIHLRMGSTYVIFEKRGRQATDDLQGWTSRVVNVQDRFRDSTIESRRQLYFQRIRPRVEHLRAND